MRRAGRRISCSAIATAPPVRRQIVETARRNYLAQRGFAVALNAPYAGGFTTGHYGRPRHGRHALQIELNRALYMDERNYRRRPDVAQLSAAAGTSPGSSQFVQGMAPIC